MSNLLPERWSEALERVNDKIGHFLTKVAPWKKQEQSPERITTDTLPAFMKLGGPLLDMHETPEELIVRAEVPGLNKDDFSVELVGRRLTIHGEKKIVREQKGGDGCLISERRYGSFSRSISLPYDIDEKTIKADLKQGVLTVRLPKPEKEQHTRYRVPVS
ncbi:Hsp20/alpha crystallin family protein [Trichlorobacter lovleyi]|jgi:Molecular chaperone (small heat shock protein)|uniref:Heat shock protein Hsp20 n=1 Tax=Trichlorobacter lovleyi (strain ATCC BAA-1151 / DSM 17278 / SZ) TaxID=398767 RepID=B3EA90_TRIL1|nr:Hsp20/alpha crystallin family protein [Trichlorobacter lovleyi]ACD93918.1 heat shock protein Hsp20 [Trichlorobacter lovleyi SZ]